jgi:hypothetical protein
MRRVSWVLVVATLVLSGCANILGIEDVQLADASAAADGGADGGAAGTAVTVEGGIRSLGAGSVGNQGFEPITRTCAGARCVTGGVVR